MVDAATWPSDRLSDFQDQEKLLQFLEEKSQATEEHIEAVRKEKGCMRIRPEEAGGSGYYNIWPVTFNQAEPASLEILNQISDAISAIAPTLSPPIDNLTSN